MINSIMKLGEYSRNKSDRLDPMEKYLEDPVGKRKGIILSIILQVKNQKDCQFLNIGDESYDSKKFRKILFRSGSPRGANVTPTAPITELERTFTNKILGWFSSFLKNKDNKELYGSEISFVQSVYHAIEKDKAAILEELNKKFDEIDKKETNAILTLKFSVNGQVQYLGDTKFFRKIIVRQATEGYRFVQTFRESSYQENQICSICSKMAAEVLGYFSYFSFYTLDKPGFISGGFRYRDSWKNYPVCADCASLVEEGKKFLDRVFTFRFYSFRYYLIPTFQQQDSAEVLEAMESWVTNPNFHTTQPNRITNDENEILELITQKGDVLSLRFLFFQQIQSALRILLVIEDVLPSRLSKLFKLKRKLDQVELFQWKKDDEAIKISFNFGILRNFYPGDKIYGIRDRYFLELCGKVISGRTIDFPFLLKGIMSKIRFLFANDQALGLQIKSGFMLLLFINELKLFQNFRGKGITMKDDLFKDFVILNKEEFPQKAEQFFSAFEAFFTTPADKAVFLTGVLTQFLLNIQKHDKGGTPFRTRLKGLKMNGEQISQLLPQIQEKLEQYGKNYYHALEQCISSYYLKAGKPNTWNLSMDEMNFIFTLGVNLSNYFKIQKQEGETNE